MMMLGYARVSTNEQDTSAQVSALKSAGCGKIFLEKASGGRWDRPELHRLLDQLRKGDIVVCCRLDRISRSVRDILMIMERIKEAARKQGRIGGRRPKLRPNQQDEIVAMVTTSTKTAADAARLFAVHPATVSRLLAKAGAGTVG
jgi:DNA invertase Pin-like site-specific DNA recombinase